MSFELRFTPEAQADLQRLYDVLLEQDLQAAKKALATIERSLDFLCLSPFSCRKAPVHPPEPRFRELVIGFGRAGCVALFEIENAKTVTVLAVRHQREDDYH